uniref:N-acetylgalactosaminide beta-1,3-galactosyltransferase n=1 Tax=Latimeria chalumnae TaxID=7897 RepID=H3APM5_LATCH
AEELFKKIKVLCWIMTAPQNLQKRAQYVKITWGKRCNVLLFMSSETNHNFPTIGLNTSEGRTQLYLKTMKAFQYAHDHYIDKADWFLKTDDDTYVILENLRLLLAKYNPDEPLYMGKRFKVHVKQGYMSGGAGYILSREALKQYVKGLKSKICSHTTSVEDLAIGHCMEKLGIPAGDSRDIYQRETFFPFSLTPHLVHGSLSKSSWFWRYNYYDNVDGPKCCSDLAISFHYVDGTFMCMLEFYIYHLRAIGYRYRLKTDFPSQVSDVGDD